MKKYNSKRTRRFKQVRSYTLIYDVYGDPYRKAYMVDYCFEFKRRAARLPKAKR